MMVIIMIIITITMIRLMMMINNISTEKATEINEVEKNPATSAKDTQKR